MIAGVFSASGAVAHETTVTLVDGTKVTGFITCCYQNDFELLNDVGRIRILYSKLKQTRHSDRCMCLPCVNKKFNAQEAAKKSS